MQVKNSVYLALLAGLAGCATLPSSGPTGGQIEKSLTAPKGGSPIQLVQINTAADVPNNELDAHPASLLPDVAPPPTDMVGPGDVLDINIYEAGVTLFAGASNGAGQMITPGVQVQKLPPTRVDDLGDISIPYAKTLHVAGLTVGQVEAMVRNSLEGLSQNPQVRITLSQAITNSIIVGGEVGRPGRLVLLSLIHI